MMNRRRIDALERQFQQAEDEPTLDVCVAEMQRLKAWLAEKGFPDDPHGAMAAGLRTPECYRFASLEKQARVMEECEVFQWFMHWGFIVEARRRLTDPNYARDYFEQHFRSQIEKSTHDAEEVRAKLASWGVSVANAMSRARSMDTERRHNGYRKPDEEFERITAAILDYEHGSDSEQ
jgi:hypothetical protein